MKWSFRSLAKAVRMYRSKSRENNIKTALDGIDFESEYELIKAKKSLLPASIRAVIVQAVESKRKQKEEKKDGKSKPKKQK